MNINPLNTFRLKRLFAFAALPLLVYHLEADWLVSSQTGAFSGSILRYSDTGDFIGVFASDHGIADPLGMTVGPDTNLYVASANSGQVLRFHGQTGAFIDVFASGGGMDAPINLTFGPDRNLYVSSGYNQILRFNGTNGTLFGAFVSGGRLAYPRGLQFGPDGNLYVVNYNTSEVLRFCGTNGAFMDAFIPAGSGGLFTPSDLTFGPDGNLYVTGGAYPTPGVFRYDGTTGVFIDQFATFPEPNRGAPVDLAFGPDRNLYVVSQGAIFGVLRFNGQNGAFTDYFVPDSSGGLSNPFGIAFLPAVAQLTNHPPIINCSEVLAECNAPAMATALVSDPDGDPLQVIWSVNGALVQTNTISASNSSIPTQLSLVAKLPLGTNFLTVTASDCRTNSASCSTLWVERDTIPPVITRAAAWPGRLWPPNHKMASVCVLAHAFDTCNAVSWKIISVTCNDSVSNASDHTLPDWIITGNHTVKLRAEHSAPGRDRVYSIRIQATDASGNVSAPATVKVIVSH